MQSIILRSVAGRWGNLEEAVVGAEGWLTKHIIPRLDLQLGRMSSHTAKA